MPLLSLDDIEATTFQALSGHGADDWIAHAVADAVRKAEAVGNRICGLYYLESYCQQLTALLAYRSLQEALRGRTHRHPYTSELRVKRVTRRDVLEQPPKVPKRAGSDAPRYNNNNKTKL